MMSLRGMEGVVLFLLPVLPLLGAVCLGFLCLMKGVGTRVSGYLASAAAIASFVVSCLLFHGLLAEGRDAYASTAWSWIPLGSTNVIIGLRFDRLSSVMSLVVTGVGSLIHLYSIGYMQHDPSRPRFFAYLNLFLAAMLILVLADNLLLAFVGWEGVGLCSYLLIGFWFEEQRNSKAGQKAFIVNRVGDAGFLLGLFLLAFYAETVGFSELADRIGGLSPYIVECVAFCFLAAAVGKSAQIPLFVWLPDAMAGPTPVSALIHAATMVTAGVYMVTRLGFVFVQAPYALGTALILGTLTALVGASTALVQTDIKRVLAFSTVSQLGYMFVALGAGAFSYAIFHIVTHAFFKACLFMAAGSVIVACHHEQEMSRFGGLWKHMRVTFLCYAVSALALAGVPPTSGYYSKDGILWAAYSNPLFRDIDFPIDINISVWLLGIVTTFLTGCYITRSVVLTFLGSCYRGHAEPGRCPFVMTAAVFVLAVLSFGFSLLYGEDLLLFLGSWGRADLESSLLEHNPVFHMAERAALISSCLGIATALFCFLLAPWISTRLAAAFQSTHSFLASQWCFDIAYERFLLRPLAGVSAFSFRACDTALIDGSVNGLGRLTLSNARCVSRIQSGSLGVYLLVMLLALIALLCISALLI